MSFKGFDRGASGGLVVIQIRDYVQDNTPKQETEGSLTGTRRIVHNLHPVVSSPDLIMPRRSTLSGKPFTACPQSTDCAVVWLRSVQATVGLRVPGPCPSRARCQNCYVEWIQILLGQRRCMFWKLPVTVRNVICCDTKDLQEKFVAVALIHSGWTRWVLLSRITSDLPVTTFNTVWIDYRFIFIWSGIMLPDSCWDSWVRSEFDIFRCSSGFHLLIRCHFWELDPTLAHNWLTCRIGCRFIHTRSVDPTIKANGSRLAFAPPVGLQAICPWGWTACRICRGASMLTCSYSCFYP